MLKRRIKNIEKQVSIGIPKKKELRVWTVTVDETRPDIEDPDKEANKQIEEIKSGKVKHRDGSYYSEEDFHLLVIRIITNNRDLFEER